jgi:hypothetical protein
MSEWRSLISLPKQQVAEKKKRNENDSISVVKGTILVFINVFSEFLLFSEDNI